jgi:dTDP-4-amino-4,6-dideoxygalactose transaminase
MGTPREVPFLDLGRLHASIHESLGAAIDAVIADSAFIGGARVEEFERALAEAHGVTQAVGCGSGTDALALVLRAGGIGDGDEVIVPSMTFSASAEAVLHAGATPVIVDVRHADLLIDPVDVERVTTERTKAIMPVHLYGNMVEPALLKEWAAAGLLVVEDAAQAVLGRSHGVGVGAIGNAACLSFFPGKNLGALGDAGAVLTNDGELAERVKRLRDHGRTSKYEHEVLGYASRLDALQAAVLRVKLDHLPAWTKARQERAMQYRALFAEPVPGVELLDWHDGAVHHLVVARVPADSRDELRTRLAAVGIATGIHYPVPLSRQPYLRPFARPCPVAEEAGREILSLPIDPLMEPDDVEYVVTQLRHQIAV